MDLFNTVIMIIISIVISYLILSNIMLTKKIYNHLNKVYMSLLMGSIMGIISAFTMMWNTPLLIISVVITIVLILMIRKQTLITDQEFLKGMVEHHQAAILMANGILKKTKSNTIRNLSNNIIETQEKEIEEMINLIDKRMMKR